MRLFRTALNVCNKYMPYLSVPLTRLIVVSDGGDDLEDDEILPFAIVQHCRLEIEMTIAQKSN